MKIKDITVKTQLNELDNGPGGTYNDGVHHGVARDAAKIDYSNYGAEAGENARRLKAQKAQQRSSAGMIARRERAAQRGVERDENNAAIMMKIDMSIGEVFPDGDPFEYLSSNYRNVTIERLDKAVRATKNGRDYNSYIKKIWQQHLDDNPEAEFGDNPW